MKTRAKSIILASLLMPIASQAGGLYLYEIGTSDLGFAGAGSAARAADASTLYTNPAGMTQLSGDHITGAIQALYGEAKYELDGAGALNGSNPENAIGLLPSGSFFYTHSIDDRLKIGVGFYSNFGLSLDFGETWAGKNLTTTSTLISATLQPTIAYRLNNEWSIGYGLTANYGYFALKREKILNDGTGEMSDGDWSFGSRVGVMYEPSKQTRFGFVWESATEYDFGIDGTITILGQNRVFPMAASLSEPQQFIASAFCELNDNWAIMGNIGWQDWSKFANTTVETDALGATTSKLQVQDTYHVAFGGRYKISPTTMLNSGVAYDTNMYKNQNNTSFAIPSGEAIRIGLGMDYALSSASTLGWAYEYMRISDSKDTNALVSGEYNNPYLMFLALNYSYRF